MPALNRPAWVEVDLNAISQNITHTQHHLGLQTDIMAIVKANAYGHGLIAASKAALQGGAKALGVALFHEGQQLRQAGITAPILVLSPTLPPIAPLLIEHNLDAVVSQTENLQALANAAKAQKTQARVHLKIDTGMGRIGCTAEEGLQLLQQIHQNPHLFLAGIMSHIAYEKKEDHPRIEAQIAKYQSFLDQSPQKAQWHHLANSATTLQFPKAHYNLVRAGLLTYGLPPTSTQIKYKPALSLKAHITQIQNLPSGQALSYGGTATLTRPSCIATIPLGYADGYNKRLSNRAHVLVHDQKCPVIGTICMDLTLIDVTDVPQCKLGDEVILIGASQTDQITPQDIATWSDTIVHEVISQLSPRLPRRHLT